jgi:hypothetical protein
MNEVKILHRDAMEQADIALAARLRGESDLSLRHFREAFGLESKAALLLVDNRDAEPNRSILLRSAAALALDCDYFTEAERLICSALAGNPPDEIAEELRDLLEQVYFRRHLELRGIILHSDELQMSIAGRGIGLGIAPADAFIDRVEKTEALLYRTAERAQKKPYRERGRRDRELQDNLELFMSIPRAASFAVTFKVGKTDQLSFPGVSLGEQVIEEFFECLEIFTHGDERMLRERIAEEAYYRNFVGLARGIAPDGEDVNLVGFTTLRNGSVKKVALEAKQERSSTALLATAPARRKPISATEVQVSGTLKLADARKAGRDEIQIIDSGGFRHMIVVPPGMMSDIVKPLWDMQVVVSGVQRGKKIELDSIRPQNPRELPTPDKVES